MHSAQSHGNFRCDRKVEPLFVLLSVCTYLFISQSKSRQIVIVNKNNNYIKCLICDTLSIEAVGSAKFLMMSSTTFDLPYHCYKTHFDWIPFYFDSICLFFLWVFILLILNFLFLRQFFSQRGYLPPKQPILNVIFKKSDYILYWTISPRHVCCLHFSVGIFYFAWFFLFALWKSWFQFNLVICNRETDILFTTEQITHIERYRPTASYFVWLFFASICESLLFCILFESFSRCLFIIFPFIRLFCPHKLQCIIQSEQWAYREVRIERKKHILQWYTNTFSRSENNKK